MEEKKKKQQEKWIVIPTKIRTHDHAFHCISDIMQFTTDLNSIIKKLRMREQKTANTLRNKAEEEGDEDNIDCIKLIINFKSLLTTFLCIFIIHNVFYRVAPHPSPFTPLFQA